MLKRNIETPLTGFPSMASTATTTDNIDTYEVYTIQGPDKTYIAREKLLFPWSKPMCRTVGC